MVRQLAFPLPRRPERAEGDFFVSDANALAHRTVLDPGGWTGGRLALVGPAGSGKSHLVGLVVAGRDAAILPARTLPGLNRLPETALVEVEDADGVAGDRAAETALFHLYNHATSAGMPLLVTGRSAPAQWAIGLPDLASRLQSMPVVRIDPPDDALLLALLTKLFGDRQLAPPPEIIARLASRIDRSYAAAQAVVERLDDEALDRGRSLTWPFVREVLEGMSKDA